jgi:hypothetical protein
MADTIILKYSITSENWVMHHQVVYPRGAVTEMSHVRYMLLTLFLLFYLWMDG